MPSCSEFLEHLSDFVDGRLDRRQSRRFEVHVRRCPRCAGALTALERGLDLLRAGEDVVPSPLFRQRLAARLEREVRIGDPIQPTSAGWAVALLIGAAVGLTLMRPALVDEPAVPVLAERPEQADPFREPATEPLPAPVPVTEVTVERLPVDVTLVFTHAEPAFSSVHPPAGMPALFER